MYLQFCEWKNQMSWKYCKKTPRGTERSPQTPADGFNLCTEWTTIPRLFVSREKTSLTKNQWTGAPYHRESTRQPLGGRAGTWRCRLEHWGETEKVTRRHVVHNQHEPSHFAYWRHNMEKMSNYLSFRGFKTKPTTTEHRHRTVFAWHIIKPKLLRVTVKGRRCVLWCLGSPSRKRKWSLLIVSPARMSSIIHSSLWAWDWSWETERNQR